MNGDRHPYEQRYIAFLDVLGFSTMVEQSNSGAAREEIYRIIHTLRNGVGFGGDNDTRITQFSDCVVLSSRPSRSAVFWILTAAQYLAATFIEQGVLIRGGIAFGPLIHDDTALFGPAMLTAYRLDASGGAPRILLDCSIISEIPHDDDYYLPDEFIRFDHRGGAAILHTFNAYTRASRSIDRWPDWRRNEYEDIVGLIGTRCSDPALSESARDKWLWTREYWNAEVASEKGIGFA